ncbi:anaerobic ribonucleoside-triphosphate reductase activating protein [Demequina sp. TTPB684]|uniref:anaerobic ribonucleoside-triphosphate reductase activating protein n=1 Tax=unclassified Demequina TaxID=2620311 RepID=UPI001CF16891|nr:MULTISPECIES: anaerobic ribonucleoside-triphosphate reductase activating protein [unclassified Demequina]MCB2412850.1 anaerobic ribonucleoside-triphosphate reductase activating protein [Demequina sp. TTPB684]UPU87520.1 anaerobic ribonucleoside-triphosphate reductase activating protein [Demequina sp. TMPB413]
MSLVAGLFGPDAPVAADDLQIAGFERFSTVDWPGKLVASVFAQGCPWECAYCHNIGMQPMYVDGLLPWAAVSSHLAQRMGKLDGVIFSGGEPTRQRALIPAMQEALAMGFGVGLHSAGAYPVRLADALTYCSWLGLDIKATPEGYVDITGISASGAKAWESLEIAIAWGGELQVRLTVDPTHHSRDDVWAVVNRVQEMGGPRPVLQEARPDGTSEEYQRALGSLRLKDVMTPRDHVELGIR